MSAGGRGFVRRSGFTIAYQGGAPNQKPSGLACVDPYQTLPDPVLTERIALVVLVWSGPGLPTVTTTSHVPADAFWLVWISLPIVTKSPFWVHTCRGTPLPIITTATKGLTIEPGIDDRATSIGHQGTGGARVIRVDNGAEPLGTIRSGCTVAHGGGRHREENLFFNQADRLVNLCLWW